MAIQPARTLRSIRILLVTLTLALAATMGVAATDVSADVLVPAREIGSGGGSDPGEDADTGRVLHQNELSLIREESKLAQGGRLADWSDVAATQASAEVAPWAQSPNETNF